PLHGVPVALKDLYDTRGVRTTGSSRVLEHRIPSEDATTTARLKEAGSILMGKLAMHEFALGGPPTSLFEPPHNPWNPELVTGGSSTGSGAAVAAGLCAGSLGSDTGGSIRMPASLCGVVGLKPTYGRVSRCGVIPLSWSLDHCGPLTWTVEDAAIMLQAIAGRDAKDPTSSTLPVPDYSLSLTEDVRGLTVGIPRQYLASISDRIDPEIQSAVEKALASLEELGAHLEEVEIPSLEYAGIANTVIMVSEAYAYHLGNLRSQLENFGEIIRTRFCMGALLTAGDYLQAQRARSRVKRECGAVFQKVDVLAMPTSLRPAVSFEDYDPMSIIMNPSFTAPWNSAGLPAISIPCGFN
ncbi:MAG: amidase, partial [Dehalococcoidia bacterium]